MKKHVATLALLLIGLQAHGATLNTRLLLNYCGYAILSYNSPGIRFTESEIVKATTCEYYIAGVSDSMMSLRIEFALRNKTQQKNNQCYKKWLHTTISYSEQVKAFYQYVNTTPSALKMPPNIAVSESYTKNFTGDC
jgi:hypothetical protein